MCIASSLGEWTDEVQIILHAVIVDAGALLAYSHTIHVGVAGCGTCLKDLEIADGANLKDAPGGEGTTPRHLFEVGNT